jgi:hypothetical protein
MLDFKDLGVKPPEKKFNGTKMPIRKVIDKPIVVNDFKIEPSRYPESSPDGNRVVLQFTLNGSEHILFSNSGILMGIVKQIDKAKQLPFATTIIEEFGSFKFT